MNRKKRMLSVLVMLVTTTVFYAQRPDWDKIKSLKIAYITEHLALTPKEAQEFWPVYNKYETDRDALRNKERNEIRDKMRQMDGFSEKDASLLLDNYLKLEEEAEELDKVFLQRLSKVISAKKTLLLLRTEEDFKRQLIKQYRQKRGGQ